MPNNIKPGEVSAVLLQQLQNISTEVQFEEVGTVLTVGDGVARIYGLSKVTENELIEFDNGVMAVAMNLEEDNVGAVILGSSEGIKEGDSVKRTGRVASIMVNENMLGRVISPLGNPLDGGGDIEVSHAPRPQSARCDLPPTGHRVFGNRSQERRLHDPHRTRTTRIDHW